MNKETTEQELVQTLAPDEKIVLKSQIKSLISKMSEEDCSYVFHTLKERGIL